jgi:hypothetical protein
LQFLLNVMYNDSYTRQNRPSVMYNTILKYKENKNRNITIMNQGKMEQLNLQSQKLTIDYLSFNIPGFLQKDYLRKVALYLFESFGFNATFKREQLDQKETFFSSDKNSHEVNFVHYDYNPKVKSFWEGTKVNFTGDNAKYFYNQIKNNQLDRNIFDLTKFTFARIDVNSLRESKITDTNQSIEDFMELSRRRVITKNKRRKASWEYEETGLVLRVGKRGNSRYYRVYQIDTDHNFKGLKFEFEFKPSRLLKELFMDNSIQHFEHELIKEYYSYSFRSVTLNSPYSDWLLYWYRKFSQKPNPNGFITTYFKQELTANKELIFNYLRTLSYIHKHGKKQQKFQINDQQQTFYEVTFRLIDFIRYVKGDEKNHRQRNRMVEIFKQFQDLHQFQLKTFQTTLDDNLILNDNSQFTSVVLIPYFSIQKKGNIWNVTLLVARQFYDYNFPFQFNHYFLHWKNIQHFEVQTQVILILGQTTIKKKLDVKQFMKPFEKVSNVKKTTVKRILIESIDQEIQNKFLQPKFRIVQKDNSIKYLDQIKPINITKAKFIYFYENINIRDLLKQI